GNDVGTQYRSAILYHSEEQRKTAEATRDAFQPVLERAGHGRITTEIAPLRASTSPSTTTSSTWTRTRAVTAGPVAPAPVARSGWPLPAARPGSTAEYVRVRQRTSERWLSDGSATVR